MKPLLLIVFLYSTIVSCKDTKVKDSLAEPKGTVNPSDTDKSSPGHKIEWLDSSIVNYQVDTFLTHSGKAFLCDSAIAIDYTGFSGEHTFMPLNDNGQWISTIKKSEKLTNQQLQLVQSVLGNKKSFDNPMMVSCFEPRLGIVYFKDSKVIAQSAICLGCARLKSTAKLGDGENYSSFSELTSRQLEKLCSELQFSNCKHWQK